MNLLDSPWFLQMAETQARTPADRLVAVFRVIAQWVAAPGVRDQLARDHAEQPLAGHAELRRYLHDTAAAARAANPGVLASQLVILLQGALAEELRNPQAQAMQGAVQAAQAIVASTCRAGRHWQRARLFGGALAASLLAGVLTLHGWSSAQPVTPAPLAAAHAQPRTAGLSPETLSAALLLHDRIEQGICPAPQLIAMNQDQVAAYQRIASLSLAGSAQADDDRLRAFLHWYASTRASECYMAPANGHTTVAWVTRTAR